MRMTTSRDERPGRSDGAPVITEHGTWGSPPPSIHFEPLERRSEARTWTTLALAALVALWVCTLALSQMTSRQVAIPTAERGIAAVTEIDSLLALHEDELRAASTAGGDKTVDLAGFPIQDVLLKASEIHCSNGVLDRAALRSVLLSRGAELLYLRGSAAFTDPSRSADPPPALSSTWGVRLLLDSIGSGLHERISMAVWAIGGLVGVTAGLLLLLGRRSKLGRIGWALFLGALPVLLAASGLWVLLFLFGRVNGGMLHEFVSISRSLVALGAQDALLVCLAGLGIAIPASLARR